MRETSTGERKIYHITEYHNERNFENKQTGLEHGRLVRIRKQKRQYRRGRQDWSADVSSTSEQGCGTVKRYNFGCW